MEYLISADKDGGQWNSGENKLRDKNARRNCQTAGSVPWAIASSGGGKKFAHN